MTPSEYALEDRPHGLGIDDLVGNAKRRDRNLIGEHGIRPFLHTFYTAPVLDGDRLKAVVVENKNGRQAIRGRQFVDATGDGDLARHTGVPMRKTGEALQPPTTCAKVRGLESLGDFDWQAAVAAHGAEFGLPPDWGWGGPIPGLPEVQLRADSHVFGVDPSDANQLTRAEIEGRRQVRAVMDVIRKYGPETARLTLVDLAAAVGTRETARAAARYRVTGDDVLYGRRFDDAIANGTYPADTHRADGPGISFRFLDGAEVTIAERGAPEVRGRWRDPLPEDPTFYQVPFRALLPRGPANLVLAGRILDADKTAFSAVRVMVNLNQTGEAAGEAAALAVASSTDVANVPPSELRQALSAGGSIILNTQQNKEDST